MSERIQRLERCETCYWWERWESSETDRGDCRVDAPRAVSGGRDGVSTRWPAPKAHHFCGRWRPRNPQSSAVQTSAAKP